LGLLVRLFRLCLLVLLGRLYLMYLLGLWGRLRDRVYLWVQLYLLGQWGLKYRRGLLVHLGLQYPEVVFV
jgi:hypothetical protein